MFKIYSILIFLFLFIGYSNLNAQSFKNYYILKEGKYVYFTLTGIRDQDHANEIYSALSKDQNVSECIINKSKDIFVGKMFLKNDLEADYFRKILQLYQADFETSSLINNSILNTSGMTNIQEEHLIDVLPQEDIEKIKLDCEHKLIRKEIDLNPSETKIKNNENIKIIYNPLLKPE